MILVNNTSNETHYNVILSRFLSCPFLRVKYSSKHFEHKHPLSDVLIQNQRASLMRTQQQAKFNSFFWLRQATKILNVIKRKTIPFYKSNCYLRFKKHVFHHKVRVELSPVSKKNATSAYSECRCKPPHIFNLITGGRWEVNCTFPSEEVGSSSSAPDMYPAGPISTFGPDIDCPDWGFSWSCSAPPGKCRTIPKLELGRSLSCTFLSIIQYYLNVRVYSLNYWQCR
jgi:hypothetical protein